MYFLYNQRTFTFPSYSMFSSVLSWVPEYFFCHIRTKLSERSQIRKTNHMGTYLFKYQPTCCRTQDYIYYSDPTLVIGNDLTAFLGMIRTAKVGTHLHISCLQNVVLTYVLFLLAFSLIDFVMCYRFCCWYLIWQ